MRKKRNEKKVIKVTEEVRVGNYILEPGDRVKVLNEMDKDSIVDTIQKFADKDKHMARIRKFNLKERIDNREVEIHTLKGNTIKTTLHNIYVVQNESDVIQNESDKEIKAEKLEQKDFEVEVQLFKDDDDYVWVVVDGYYSLYAALDNGYTPTFIEVDDTKTGLPQDLERFVMALKDVDEPISITGNRLW